MSVVAGQEGFLGLIIDIREPMNVLIHEAVIIDGAKTLVYNHIIITAVTQLHIKM
jgi:hypothetical protein